MSTVSLHGPGSRRDFAPASRFGPIGIGVMVLSHVVLGWALFSGLGQQVIAIVKKPLAATIIQEVKLPPPPPPPEPPKPIPKEPPKLAPPPPAYVPPPEVAPPAVEPAPSITAVQTREPVAPPPPAPATPTPEPVAVPAARRLDIAVICPKQARPEMPPRAVADGVSGTVRVELRIAANKVADVKIVSGPRVFHNAVRVALAQYECQTEAGQDVIATQEFAFKVE